MTTEDLGEALIKATKHGMDSERARIVAWLRKRAEVHPGISVQIVFLADKIERGEHLK